MSRFRMSDTAALLGVSDDNELVVRGHTDVTALDVAGDGLAVARDRLGGAGDPVSWVVADLQGWQPDRRFDVWHDRAVFHFLTDPADQARYRVLLDTLADGGIVVIGTFAEDGPPACSGLPTTRYSADDLLDTLGVARRWTELGRRREHHATPFGADQTFTWLALQRRPA